MISNNSFSNAAGNTPLMQTGELMFERLGKKPHSAKLDQLAAALSHPETLAGSNAALLDENSLNNSEPNANSTDATSTNPHDNPKLRKVFGDFVGQTFYGQMLSAMRKTVDKSAYFHGGRGEEVFQGQLDQVLTEKMAEATADQFAGPMYDLFLMQRK